MQKEGRDREKYNVVTFKQQWQEKSLVFFNIVMVLYMYDSIILFLIPTVDKSNYYLLNKNSLLTGNNLNQMSVLWSAANYIPAFMFLR